MVQGCLILFSLLSELLASDVLTIAPEISSHVLNTMRTLPSSTNMIQHSIETRASLCTKLFEAEVFEGISRTIEHPNPEMFKITRTLLNEFDYVKLDISLAVSEPLKVHAFSCLTEGKFKWHLVHEPYLGKDKRIVLRTTTENAETLIYGIMQPPAKIGFPHLLDINSPDILSRINALEEQFRLKYEQGQRNPINHRLCLLDGLEQFLVCSVAYNSWNRFMNYQLEKKKFIHMVKRPCEPKYIFSKKGVLKSDMLECVIQYEQERDPGLTNLFITPDPVSDSSIYSAEKFSSGHYMVLANLKNITTLPNLL